MRRDWIARVAMVAVSACSFGSAGAEGPGPMQTRCLARFLIDLPEDFEQVGDVELVYGPTSDFRKVQVELERNDGSTAAFENIAAQRAADLASQIHLKAVSKSMLVSNRRVNDDVVLIRSYDDLLMLEYFRSEVYARKGQAIAKVTAQIYRRDQPEAIEASALSVVEQTTFVADPASARRGTCFGPLLIDAGQDGEWFTVAFKSKRMPDVRLEFDSNSLLAESDGGLLARVGRGPAPEAGDICRAVVLGHFENGWPTRIARIRRRFHDAVGRDCPVGPDRQVDPPQTRRALSARHRLPSPVTFP